MSPIYSGFLLEDVMAEPTVQQGGATPAAPAVPTRPDFLDPRFNSVEEQARAYKEAEKQMQLKANQTAELERQNRELLSRQQAQPAAVTPHVEDHKELNEQYWTDPVGVLKKVVHQQTRELVMPFYDDKIESQKSALRAENPNVDKYFPQVDAMIKAQPDLRFKPGIVRNLVKVASAMEFDADAERKRITEEVKAQLTGKVVSQVEGAGAGSPGTQVTTDTLNADEKHTAERFHPELSREEAHKLYAENKLKLQQRQGA
jgi:hypothetical protein